MFYEGAKVLYRVSAMLVIQNRERILACKSFTEITDVFKEIVNNPKIVDCQTFLQVGIAQLAVSYEDGF